MQDPFDSHEVRNAAFYEERRKREDSHKLDLLHIRIDALVTHIKDVADDMHEPELALDLLGYIEDAAGECEAQAKLLVGESPWTTTPEQRQEVFDRINALLDGKVSA